MTAGITMQVSVTRFTYTDDEGGGSVPSGTCVYQNLSARRIEHPDYKLLNLTAGQESERMHLFHLYPASITLCENDELQIINPPNHWDYHQWFRVLQVKRVGFHPLDPRGYILCTCKRSVESHAIQ